MNLPKRRLSTTKKLATIIVVIILIILCVMAIAFIYVYKFDGEILGWTKNQTTSNESKTDGVSKINYDKPTKDQKNAGSQVKQQSLSEGKPTESSENESSTITEQPGKDKVTIAITTAQKNGNNLQIRAQIYATINNGTCTLMMTNEAKTLTKTASIQALPNSSTCKGFDIPISELSTGSWQLKLHFENDSLIGEDSREISI